MRLLIFLFFKGVTGGSNQSFEHLIRAHLLDNYDKTVRPILGNGSVEVSFGMKISRLVKVVSMLVLTNVTHPLKFAVMI